MAERAHPKEFTRFKKIKIFGLIPFLKANPYWKALHWRYELANKYCKSKNVLDIPCGMGWGTSLLKNANHVTGIDISEEAISEAKLLYGNFAKFEVGSMNAIGYPEESFDTIVCLEGFEHVSEEIGDRFLIEASRVLKSKGTLVLSSPYPIVGTHSGNPYHIKEYRPEEVREKLNNCGFIVLKENQRKVDQLIMSIFVAQKN
ncbi:class I SAM-dependent methyltransferase [Maribellus sp. YY47]|uniref:class I SAM-dependent methyltransferase n=1 Tax=Maribellus sp. YY47 TaxID=2929486 RepID=UPI002000E35C|nr:class I SAM-dependent methyltransferase [Maribellus sp. YY47]MCK3683746.1 class I SAM-dependent methyltransferase [Maribellus sp. YY47]